MSFFSALVHCDDRAADSLIVGCLASLGVMFGLNAWSVIANHMDFDPSSFGMGAGAILVGLGGGRMARDNIKFKRTVKSSDFPAEGGA